LNLVALSAMISISRRRRSNFGVIVNSDCQRHESIYAFGKVFAALAVQAIQFHFQQPAGGDFILAV
jgi:hypothetical protein